MLMNARNAVKFNERELLTCEPVLQELRKVLAEKFRLPEPVIKAFLAFLRTEGELVSAHEPSPSR